MDAIRPSDDLTAWLADKPPAWSAALALRIALRIVPIACNPVRFKGKRAYTGLTLALYRALSISAVAATIPTAEIGRAADAAYAAANAAASAAASAAGAAANAANTANAASAAGAAAANANAAHAAYAAYAAGAAAANAAYAADAAYAAGAAAYAVATWQAITIDTAILSQGEVAALLRQPLWPDAPPPEFVAEIGAMQGWMQASDQGFGLWWKWYARISSGQASPFGLPPEADLEMGRRLIAQHDDWWKREPAVVNAEIQGWLDELTPPPSVDAQSDYGLIFRATPQGSFDVNEQSGSDEVLETPEARDRHEHLRDSLIEAAALAKGDNIAGDIAPRLEKWLEFLGAEPREMRLGRLLQHAEFIIPLAEALAKELQGVDSLDQLTSRSRNLVVLLQTLPENHWAMVNFDPALARRIPLTLDPEAPRLPNVTISIVNSTIHHAEITGVLTDRAAQNIVEMGAGLEAVSGTPVSTASDPRLLRRYWETVKNWPREMLAWLWEHKVKSITSGTIAAAGKFLITYEVWVRSLFSESPGMLHLIGQLIDWLKMLPFLG